MYENVTSDKNDFQKNLKMSRYKNKGQDNVFYQMFIRDKIIPNCKN